MPDKKQKLRGDDPRLNAPKLRGDSRVLEIEGETWQWNTNGHMVAIYSPTGVKTEVEFVPADEKGKWEITPSDVTDYIKKELR